MAQSEALLDTDTLSAVIRGHPLVVPRARGYLVEHGSLVLSIITRYEILRGLKAKNATAQVQAFDRLCETCRILPLRDEVVVRRSTSRELAAAVIPIRLAHRANAWEAALPRIARRSDPACSRFRCVTG